MVLLKARSLRTVLLPFCLLGILSVILAPFSPVITPGSAQANPTTSAAVNPVFQGSSTDLIGPDTYPVGVNPLTGLPVANPDLLNRRPLIVKISNYPPVVRPQSGLNAADVVWEHLLAGGVTRFAAIFLGEDQEKVGPIRSGRLVDFELVRIYRGLSVYSGMAQGTIEILRGDALMSSRAVPGDGPCPAFCRYPQLGLAYEHTLYGNTAELQIRATELKRDVEPEPVYGMAFKADAPTNGQRVNGITVRYTQTDVTWSWDESSGRWLRSQDGQPHFDALTETQVNTANVLILEEEHTVQPYISENYWGPGNFAFSVNFIGEGHIYLFRDGQVIEGVWRRAKREDPLTYFDLEGNLLPLKPGNTFIELVPRWIDGYQLVFDPVTAPGVFVTGTTGANMHVGPGTAYVALDVAYPGDSFRAIGRNKTGDWLQVQRPKERAVWMTVDRLDLSNVDLANLPVTRPTNER